MTAPVVPGVYGKLPAVGDFVSRRLPALFVRTWDAWIQEALTVSREQLDTEWLDVYLTSPIWRFIMNPGDGGEKASVGILMPSVDKVGRYFPLTLAAMLDNREALPYLFIAAADWFDALEQLALSALEDGFQLDIFDRELQDPATRPVNTGRQRSTVGKWAQRRRRQGPHPDRDGHAWTYAGGFQGAGGLPADAILFNLQPVEYGRFRTLESFAAGLPRFATGSRFLRFSHRRLVTIRCEETNRGFTVFL